MWFFSGLIESSMDSERAAIPITLAELTMTREVEQLGHLLGTSIGMTGVWESALRITELVEEGVAHRVNCRKTLSWSVLEERRNELDGVIGCLAEDLPQHQLLFSRHP